MQHIADQVGKWLFLGAGGKLINLKPHLDNERSDKGNTNLKENELVLGSTILPIVCCPDSN